MMRCERAATVHLDLAKEGRPMKCPDCQQDTVPILRRIFIHWGFFRCSYCGSRLFEKPVSTALLVAPYFAVFAAIWYDSRAVEPLFWWLLFGATVVSLAVQLSMPLGFDRLEPVTRPAAVPSEERPPR